MVDILFTDTHFGVRNNSATWFRHQSDFIYKQLIPYIKQQQEDIRLIHLGDVFDSRSSISTIIMADVRDMFAELSGVVKEFIIIAGNHDFGLMNSDRYCTPSTVFRGLDIEVVDNYVKEDGDHVYIPWYIQETEGIENLSEKYEGKRVFTHTDLISNKLQLKTPVYSGHIHTPYINGRTNNLGSCYQLTFIDNNQERSFYKLDGGLLTPITNEHSIHFWRLYDDDIKRFDIRYRDKDDYIEFYVQADHVGLYQDYIKRYQEKFRNFWVIPQTQQLTSDIQFEGCDIEKIIEQMIPDNMKPYFERLKTE